ncbi:hypothetical protein MJO28_007844 [Puccinia striiformis f. sp. tritici]|uniref:SRP9 domain-containing protein n=3 Tax=Puccinia striiformis TaxID=27350 RepID=A0A2S4UXV2_9BASI|nr:hypothetical protein MJO28_007844 [Puccinia striiformis f. sp. tritici]KAI7956376.1 hypothetical protein MJO29_007775 [Puccinia striiformis f. sp. tritici]POW02005.1 hypothetical protein PSTT_12099 [Puccinia striiformis]POW22566.1 hypothetical protein PSHT_01030 [Puccinia striiformis]
MVHLRDWDTFVSECNKLCEASPVKTRYCTKWRRELGLLVLKVTDEKKHVQNVKTGVNEPEVVPIIKATASANKNSTSASTGAALPSSSSTAKDAGGKKPAAYKKKKGKKK